MTIPSSIGRRRGDIIGKMIVREIYARRILNPTRIPGLNYSLNPYVGCAHGCVYCFADYMRKYTGHREPWGQFVDVKVNAPHLLRREIKKAAQGVIGIGVVTDPYQPVEKKYEITRRCLEVLRVWKGGVSLLTKSALVLRDVDLLREVEGLEVGISLSTYNRKFAAELEPRVPPPDERVSVLAKLAKVGIKTRLFLAPLIPGISDRDMDLEKLFEAARRARVEEILVDLFNPYPGALSRLLPHVEKLLPEKGKGLLRSYKKSRMAYGSEMKMLFLRLGWKYDVRVKFAY